MKILTIIPARGGSKGVPRKNIRTLNGKPLIAYSIEAALQSKYLDSKHIICSTDDEEIAAVARKFGARVPFMRPAQLATDEASTISVIEHALDWMEREQQMAYDYVLLLQATSPFRKAKHIDDVLQLMQTTDKDAVVSVCLAQDSPYLMKVLNEEGELTDLLPQQRSVTRRQDFPPVYVLNGAIYLTKTNSIRLYHSMVAGKVLPYVMSKEDSLDIDDEMDLLLAKMWMKNG